MLDSMRVKFTSIISPLPRRSVSIIVESKAKKIQIRRDQSQKRRNSVPQQIELTRKKFTSIERKKSCSAETETNRKGAKLKKVQSDTMFFSNNTNQNWLDFVSDIDSESEQLLPKSQQNNNDKSKISKTEQITAGSMVESVIPVKQNESIIQFLLPNSIFVNWIEENQPEQCVPKIYDGSSKKAVANEIKKKRLEEYNEQKKWINTQSPKQSSQLACTHRMHKTCMDIIKWKPKMKCNACDGRSVKDYFVNRNRIVSMRRTNIGMNTNGRNVRNL